MNVILNADDFGKSLEQNQAIDEAFKQGFVRSVGLIVTEQYLQDAINKARTGGYIKNLHLHFNLSKKLSRLPLSENDDTAILNDNKSQKQVNHFLSIKQLSSIYRELVTQYDYFIEVTNGEANYRHIDFHVWANLSWPVCLLLNLFSWKFHIKTVRYWAIAKKKKTKYKLYRILSWNPFVKSIPACSFFYFLTQRLTLSKSRTIEIFCHPIFKNGELIDGTSSYIKYEKKSLSKLMQDMKKYKDVEFVSWEDIQ